MKKNCLLMAVAGLALAAVNAPETMAQETTGVEIYRTSTLQVTGVTVTTDGEYNFKNFEVEAPEAGSYYTEFWLLPARLADGSYSTFLVYVNDAYIGAVTPSYGNWQGARVDGHETLGLSEGKNVITVATPAPEFPEVETLKAAMNDSDAVFSPEAYEEYLGEAASGVISDVPEEDGICLYAAGTESAGMAHFSNVPLNYTFYMTFNFTQGQEIYVATSSPAYHKIDVVYYGSASVTPGIVNPGDLNPGIDYPINPTGNGNSIIEEHGTISMPTKPRLPYTPATSEEMQGLNWMFPSQKTLNSSTHVATARLTVPKTGQYLIRVRHAVNGGSALADVNVNGTYYYEDMPISLSYKACVIPADGNSYATMTCCNNFGTDDPYLFIHGANGDRIVGFNDDGPKDKINQYDLSSLDSYICQRYLMKTSGISVSNFSSSKPKSSCSIIARVPEGAAQSVARLRAKGADAAGVHALPAVDESVKIEAPANIGGSISITADENIQKVSAYRLAGELIGSAGCEGSRVEMPASSLNISRPGVYVISVQTTNGAASAKIAVN